MKKYFVLLFALSVLYPSVAFAVWYNPVTWFDNSTAPGPVGSPAWQAENCNGSESILVDACAGYTPENGALTNAPAPAAGAPSPEFQFQPIVSIPLAEGGSVGANTALSCYLNSAFKLAIAVATVLAVIMIVIDGFKYMTSEAIGDKKGALSGISSAMFGLILLLASYLILFIINPQILTLSVFDVNGLSSCGFNAPVDTGAAPDSAVAPSAASLPTAINTLLNNPAPSSDELNATNEYCFTVAGGGSVCGGDPTACTTLHTVYANTNQATGECPPSSSGSPTPNGTNPAGGSGPGGTVTPSAPPQQQNSQLYTDKSGRTYSTNPGSIYYSTNGDTRYAYFLSFDLFFSGKKLKSPVRISRTTTPAPSGITPNEIKQLYHLPQTGGAGTIAIVDPYNLPSIESDLNTFSSAFGLPACTVGNGCLEEHSFATTTATDVGGWNGEIALDVEWAHALAPKAKILLVSATDSSFGSLLHAVDYAAARPDVVSVSMSWGGGESQEATQWDSHFVSAHGAKFFAAAGDIGNVVDYPAVSPNVIGVGGTQANLAQGLLSNEVAWSSGAGGISSYEPEPKYQTGYGVPQTNGKRGVPDVAYIATLSDGTGFSIVLNGTWMTETGTSAGAPQWAAIAALGGTVTNQNLYARGASLQSSTYFTDILSGANGTCGYYCSARSGYDYVTGLGSPLTSQF